MTPKSRTARLAETIGSRRAPGSRAMVCSRGPMNQVKKKQLPPRPFFTRFLDRQDLKKVSGSSDSTDKFPSDNDEHADLPET
jgi:hypothetical protein